MATHGSTWSSVLIYIRQCMVLHGKYGNEDEYCTVCICMYDRMMIIRMTNFQELPFQNCTIKMVWSNPGLKPKLAAAAAMIIPTSVREDWWPWAPWAVGGLSFISFAPGWTFFAISNRISGPKKVALSQKSVQLMFHGNHGKPLTCYNWCPLQKLNTTYHTSHTQSLRITGYGPYATINLTCWTTLQLTTNVNLFTSNVKEFLTIFPLGISFHPAPSPCFSQRSISLPPFIAQAPRSAGKARVVVSTASNLPAWLTWANRLLLLLLLLLQHDEMKVSTWSVPTSRTTAANTQTQVSESKIMNGEIFDYYTCWLWSSALIGTACTIRWKTFQKKSSKDQRMSGNCKLLTGG